MWDDLRWAWAPAPSLAKSIVIRRCAIGQQNEIDKIEYLEYDTCTGGQIFSQSSSINQLVVKNSTLTGLIGTVKDTILDNSSVGELILGPAFFGHGTRFRAKNNSKWTSARAASSGMDPNLLSFSNGTFAIANSQLANYPVNMIWAQAVPGHYFIAYYDESIHGTPDGGPMVKFQILDVRQDATNTYIDTDLGSTLPRPTFLGGNPPNQLFPFPSRNRGSIGQFRTLRYNARELMDDVVLCDTKRVLMSKNMHLYLAPPLGTLAGGMKTGPH